MIKLSNRGFIDLTNKKFGKLTVIRSDKKVGRNQYWLCKCDCGKETVVMGGALRSGHTKSCGCNHKKALLKDLTGKRFGRLVVESYSHQSGKIHYWKCKCDCGNEKIASGRSLTAKNTTSCGCAKRGMLKPYLNKYDLTGKKIGLLTVLHREVGSKWLCKCDCGNYTTVKTADLVREFTRSCGCLTSNNFGSKEEIQLLEYVKSLLPHNKIEKHNRGILEGKEIDIYIPELKVGIEYCGSAFHCTFNSKFNRNKPKYYHRDKFLVAKEKGIRLITIFDIDFIENHEAIMNKLSTILLNKEMPIQGKKVITNNDFGTNLSNCGYTEVCQIEPICYTYTRYKYIVFRSGETLWEYRGNQVDCEQAAWHRRA